MSLSRLRSSGHPSSSAPTVRGVLIRVTSAAWLITTGASQVSAAVIYETMAGAPGGFVTTVTGPKYLAAGFRTTADSILTAVDMGVFRTDVANGTVTVSIYNSNESGFPPTVDTVNQQIFSGPVTDLPDTSVVGPTFSISGLNVPLQTNTYYYLVAAYPSADSNQNLYWYQASGVTAANPAYDYQRSDSTDGTTWSFPQTNYAGPLKASISAVPEPSTAILAAAAGLGGLAFARRRWRQAAGE